MAYIYHFTENFIPVSVYPYILPDCSESLEWSVLELIYCFDVNFVYLLLLLFFFLLWMMMEYKRWSKGLLLLGDITHDGPPTPWIGIALQTYHDVCSSTWTWSGRHAQFLILWERKAPPTIIHFIPPPDSSFLWLHLVLESSCVFRIVTAHVVNTLFYLKD